MKELLFSVTKKDLNITYFSGSGAGGQHRNKHQNCVRIQHPESGALVTGQSQRERGQNTKEAFKNLIKDGKFKLWHTKKVNEMLTGTKIFVPDKIKPLKESVDDSMRPENLKIEYKVGDTWIEERSTEIEKEEEC